VSGSKIISFMSWTIESLESMVPDDNNEPIYFWKIKEGEDMFYYLVGGNHRAIAIALKGSDKIKGVCLDLMSSYLYKDITDYKNGSQ